MSHAFSSHAGAHRGEAAVPARFSASVDAQSRYGARLEQLGSLLGRSDPLADELVESFAALPAGRGPKLLQSALHAGIGAVNDPPAPLRALMAEVDRVPGWVDRRQQGRAGALVLRAGIGAGVVLGLKSLVLGYASPGGNKPLVFSGRLRAHAARRLAETSRFVQAVSQPGGMARFGPGFAITVQVRVMHAQVRRLIARSGRWRSDLWGIPINQHDMLATILLFSVALVDGLRNLGYEVTRQEAEDVVQLWRHVGVIMGVEADRLPTSEAEGLRIAGMIRATQGPPDDDARALTRALFDARADSIAAAGGDPRLAQKRRAAMHAVCRLLVGDEVASGLGIPRSPFDQWVPLIRPVAALASRFNRLPGLRHLAALVGDRYWDAAVAGGLGGKAAAYDPPEGLNP
jgi:hypothetical protein